MIVNSWSETTAAARRRSRRRFAGRRCGSRGSRSTCGITGVSHHIHQQSSIPEDKKLVAVFRQVERDIHHDLPRINRQISVVETPVELLLGLWLVGGVVVGCEVRVGEGLAGLYARSWVEDEHAFEKFDGWERC